MTEPDNDRPTLMPILTALAVVGLALIAVFVLRLIRGEDPVPDDALVGQAVVGQNDALQRGDYTDFRSFTCVSQQGIEAQVLADQKQSTVAKGARYVDDVKDVKITGDSATATVVYHFEKAQGEAQKDVQKDAQDDAQDDKVTVPMSFVRENDVWKVCSPGPK